MQLELLLNKINKIKELGNNWDKEYNTPGPNKNIISLSKKLIFKLNKLNMLPYRIAPTVEEGMFFGFRKNNKRLYLELYNNEEYVGYIINNNTTKQIIDNVDIKKNEIIAHIKQFFNKY